jgi:hypothetical protein
MKVISSDKKKILIEVDNLLELEILSKATAREARRHQSNWDGCEAIYPEELTYHADMKEISRDLKVTFAKLRKKYKS